MSDAAVSAPAPGGVVLLAGPGESTLIVHDALASRVPIEAVLLEQPPSRLKLVRNRARRLGVGVAVGQLAFQVAAVPALRRLGRARAQAIRDEFGLRPREIPEAVLRRVASANAEETIALLQALAPRVVVVNGTRILSKRLLGCVQAVFINMHAGITPLYRGVHGGYWALAQGQPEHCGVTVHLVDPGVDTGGVLGQALIRPTPEDNFTTYPLLQLAAGIPILVEAVEAALDGRPESVPHPPGNSTQWYHPTLASYLKTFARHGVK